MSESRLQKWALGAEIIGAVAVVVTLGYLAAEMRSNTRAVQAQTYQSMMQELNDYRFLFTNREMAEVMTKWQLEGWDNLTEVEKNMRWAASTTRWGIYESAYFANERGVLGSQEWTRFETAICRGREVEQNLWRGGGFNPNGMVGLLTPEFVEYVEALCE